jgi:hypothetical protein
MQHRLFLHAPSRPWWLKLLTLHQKHSRAKEKPRRIHQQGFFQALTKIYVRLVIAQSIQLSNIVLAGFHQLPASAGMGLTHFRSCTILKFLQPNVRRQATFLNRDTESVAALTPNIKLAHLSSHCRDESRARSARSAPDAQGSS